MPRQTKAKLNEQMQEEVIRRMPGDVQNFFSGLTKAKKASLATAYTKMDSNQQNLHNDIIANFGAERDTTSKKQKWKGTDEAELDKAILSVKYKPLVLDPADLDPNFVPPSDPKKYEMVSANVVVPSYIVNYNPFRYRAGFNSTENAILLNKTKYPQKFNDLMKKMKEPNVQLIMTDEKEPRYFKRELKGSCYQPVQFRIFGDADQVTDIATALNKLLTPPKAGSTDSLSDFKRDFQQILWGNEMQNNRGFIPPAPMFGFMKLEMDKKSRVGNYSANTMRVYVQPKIGNNPLYAPELPETATNFKKYPTSPECTIEPGYPKYTKITKQELLEFIGDNPATYQKDIEIEE